MNMLGYRIKRFWSEGVWLWIAHRLPARLRYWAVVDAAAKATTGKWSNQEVPALTMMDTLKRIDPYGQA